jgi:hypothetical protein
LIIELINYENDYRNKEVMPLWRVRYGWLNDGIRNLFIGQKVGSCNKETELHDQSNLAKSFSTFHLTSSHMSAPGENSKSKQVQKEVDDVVGIMHDNINKVMERGEKLDSLQTKTGLLS